jgi:hypothetical protein
LQALIPRPLLLVLGEGEDIGMEMGNDFVTLFLGAMAFVEFVEDIGRGEAAVGEEDKGVVGEVGDFFDEAFLALGFGGEDDFYRFFAYFFKDFILTFFEEVVGVGTFDRVFLAIQDDVIEFGEGHSFLQRFNSRV